MQSWQQQHDWLVARVLWRKDTVSCTVCSDLHRVSYAESQRPVRELRRPGGGKPHGQVRSMTIPAGGQVCILPNAFHPFCPNLLSGCLLSANMLPHGIHLTVQSQVLVCPDAADFNQSRPLFARMYQRCMQQQCGCSLGM